jgi:hypothetical protein
MIRREQGHVFEVTSELDFFNELYHLTDAIREELDVFLKQLNDSQTKKAIKTIEAIRIKYPHTPQVLHMMIIGYIEMGDVLKVTELRDLGVKIFPDYIHFRLDKTKEFMEANNYKGALATLGGKLCIKSMYPARNKFCYDEYVCYEREAIRYLIGIGDTDKAEDRLRKLAREFSGNAFFAGAAEIVREAKMKIFGS